MNKKIVFDKSLLKQYLGFILSPTFIGLVLFLFFIVIALIGKLIPMNLEPDYSQRFFGISWRHPLGTDYAGRDVLLLIFKGAFYVIFIALLTGFWATLIGFVLDIVAGYFGKFIDSLISRLIDIFLSVPSFPIMAILASVLKVNDIISFSFLLAIWSWPSLASSIRAQTISIKSKEFIIFYKLYDYPILYVIFSELLPLLLPIVLINFINISRGAIVASVGIMVLGLVPLEINNWGMMINLAIGSTGAIYVPNAWPYLFAPIFFIILFQISLVLLSYGIEDLFDPRLKN
ncbi:MAG: ABC transporter permease [bacterium]|nr:ABC transporter permease [bacterium]